nr:glycosyltransferase [Thermoanaerobaculia bacterium]
RRQLEEPELKVSLVVVGFRSSGVLPAALASFRREARECGLASEVVLVDHSEDAKEAARLRSLEPDQLLLEENRGYAAGLNRGIAEARGELLLLANPDLEFAAGALAPLLAAFEAGFSVVGPQFHLGRFLFPPAELQTPAEEVARVQARRSTRRRLRLMVRELGRSLRVWEAGEPVEVEALSGALLALRADTAARLGRWDEGYFLYFEETDWLRQARSRGERLAIVPAARVAHAWGHAASEHEAVYEASRRRFYRRHWGWSGHFVARLHAPEPPRWPPLAEERALLAGGERLWLVSPSAWGFPNAGAWLSGQELPSALEELAAATDRPAIELTVQAYDPASAQLSGPFSWAWTRARA